MKKLEKEEKFPKRIEKDQKKINDQHNCSLIVSPSYFRHRMSSGKLVLSDNNFEDQQYLITKSKRYSSTNSSLMSGIPSASNSIATSTSTSNSVSDPTTIPLLPQTQSGGSVSMKTNQYQQQPQQQQMQQQQMQQQQQPLASYLDGVQNNKQSLIQGQNLPRLLQQSGQQNTSHLMHLTQAQQQQQQQQPYDFSSSTNQPSIYAAYQQQQLQQPTYDSYQQRQTISQPLNSYAALSQYNSAPYLAGTINTGAPTRYLYPGISIGVGMGNSNSGNPAAATATTSLPISATGLSTDLDPTAHDAKRGRRFRRRYNQIVRKYPCSFPGCLKSYGSLNHLNTHIVTKKHGHRKSKADFQTNVAKDPKSEPSYTTESPQLHQHQNQNQHQHQQSYSQSYAQHQQPFYQQQSLQQGQYMTQPSGTDYSAGSYWYGVPPSTVRPDAYTQVPQQGTASGTASGTVSGTASSASNLYYPGFQPSSTMSSGIGSVGLGTGSAVGSAGSGGNSAASGLSQHSQYQRAQGLSGNTIGGGTHAQYFASQMNPQHIQQSYYQPMNLAQTYGQQVLPQQQAQLVQSQQGHQSPQ